MALPKATECFDGERPPIITLCGSTRFAERFRTEEARLTLDGYIVLSVGLFDATTEVTDDIKADLDQLHKRKIDMSDEVLVIDVDGYVGESTRSEITYAAARGDVRISFFSGRPSIEASSPAER